MQVWQDDANRNVVWKLTFQVARHCTQVRGACPYARGDTVREVCENVGGSVMEVPCHGGTSRRRCCGALALTTPSGSHAT